MAKLTQDQLERVAALIEQRRHLVPLIKEFSHAPDMKVELHWDGSQKLLKLTASQAMPTLEKMRSEIGTELAKFGIETNGI